MNNYFKTLMNSFVPFIMIGVGISLVIGLLIMFSYVVVWGLLIGLILWLVANVKEYFFPNATTTKSTMIISGRIIEYNNKRKNKHK